MTPGQGVLRVEQLLAGSRDGAWDEALLTAAQRLPAEHAPVLARAAKAVLNSDPASRARVWAALLAARALRPVDHDGVLVAVEEAVGAGEPAVAVLGLARAATWARAQGHRTAGEVLQLARLVVVERAAGAPALPPAPHAATGRDTGAALLDAVWPLVRGLDAAGLADVVSAVAADASLAPPGSPVQRALLLVERCLRGPAGKPLDVEWLRGEVVRGLAFAVPALGEARFAQYEEYARARDVAPVHLVPLMERWVQALTLSGRLADGRALLARAHVELEDGRSGAGPATQLLRAEARLWRIAGDPARALVHSDRALALLDEPGGLRAASRGNVWLNRAPVLEALGRTQEAYEAARAAGAAFAEDSSLVVGQTESLSVEALLDPDEQRGDDTARALLRRHRDEGLPQPIRTMTLLRCGQRLSQRARREAWSALEQAAGTAARGRRVAVEVALAATRLLLDAADVPGMPVDRLLEQASRAVELAELQDNRLLAARARMLLARCLGAEPAAAQVARAALADLSATLAGLTADGGQRVVADLRADLLGVFDGAVERQDGRLALQLAEAGRALQLSGMVRLDPDALPSDVRDALADATAALQAQQGEPPGEGPSDDDGRRTRADVQGLRSVAGEALASSRRALSRLAGQVLVGLVADADLDVDAVRDRFPRTHLLTLSEHDGVLRWTWWAPDARDPVAGRQQLPPGTLYLVGEYAGGTARRVPGDVVAGLQELLPEPLRRVLDQVREAAPLDLLVVPQGRLWQVPLVAVPVGDGRHLVHVARLSLTPSLRLALDLARRDERTGGGGRGATTYCNPQLDGAELEKAALRAAWRPIELDGVHEVGRASGAELVVIATHADAAPGLSQALIDHEGRRLAAGECLVREFPRVVVLGSCHGFHAEQGAGDPEPLGLLTVMGARGTTWTVGGHQQLDDLATAWVLTRVYRALAEGTALHDALRAAQVELLAVAAEVDRHGPTALPQELQGPDGTSTLDLAAPWCWALSVVGPPPAP